MKNDIAQVRNAAEQGNACAQNNLSKMYLYGQGLEQDNRLAYVWNVIAAANGNAEAVNDHDIFAQRLLPAALAGAQALADRYLKQCQSVVVASAHKGALR